MLAVRSILATLVVSWGLCGGAARADEGVERFALLIGNSAYEQAFLRNPVNDVTLLSERLSSVGFDVRSVEDGTERDMERAIVDFAVALQDAGPDAVGLFYYSGHGVQLNGENYLIPIGARIERQADLGAEAIRANWVIEQLETAGNAVNFVLLDACRNNPLPRSLFRSGATGLTEMRAPLGTFIGYSTAPGTVASDGEGDNSPYAAAIAAEIGVPDQAAEIVFRRVRQRVIDDTSGTQVPWDASSLAGDDFYFTSTTVTTTDPDGATTSTTTTTASNRVLTGDAEAAVTTMIGGDRIELAFWESVEDSTYATDYEAYLERYPEGVFSTIARNRIERLGAGATDITGATAVAEVTTPVVPETPIDVASALRVSASGGADFTTIQDALNAVQDGQTILVEPGEYREDLAIEREIRFTLRGLGEGDARPRVISNETRPLYVTAGQPTIENLILVGERAEYAAVWVRGGRPRLVNNEFSSTENSCIYVQQLAVPTVQNNTFDYCGYHAIVVAESATGVFQGNTIQPMGLTAVYIQGNSAPSLLNNTIRQTVDQMAVMVSEQARPYLIDNTVEGGLRGIVVGGTAAGRFERNRVSGTAEQAFLAFENASPEVVENSLSDTTGHCLHLRDSASGRFERNRLERCGSMLPGGGSYAALTISETSLGPLVVGNVVAQAAGTAIDNRNTAVDVSSNTVQP